MKLIFVFSLILVFLNSFAQKEEFYTVVENPATIVKNQAESGPYCWSYATCSFIESELLRLKKGTYDLSEDFFIYYAYIDKAHNYVLRQGYTSFRSGGLAHDVLRIIKEKGIIPEPYYKIDYIRNTHEVQEVLYSYLQAILKEEYPTENWMKHYRALLDSYFEERPDQFNLKSNTFTPITFAKFLEINVEDYVSITSFTHHSFNSEFVLELRDNYASREYYNVPLNEFVQIIDTSLIRGYTLVWDGDISKYFSANNNGLALLPDFNFSRNGKLDTNIPELDVDQENRQISFERLQTMDTHLMHIIGLARNNKGKKFYIVKDSGGDYGPYGGLIYMSEAYLKMKTIAITLNKNSLPKVIWNRMNKD